jgi:hypothetical protein
MPSVVVWLGDRVSMPEARAAFPVGIENARVRVGRCTLEPLEKRRPEVEADVLQRVDDAIDPPVGCQHARGDDGTIALLLDARIPVVVRRGGRFALDLFEPRVFAWRLIEMSVNDDAAHLPRLDTAELRRPALSRAHRSVPRSSFRAPAAHATDSRNAPARLRRAPGNSR